MQKLQIFNVSINGEKDIKWFMTLTREQQFNWVLKHSNQKNEEIINAFLDSPQITEYDCCQGCKEARQQREQNGNNISGGISETVAIDNEVISTATDGSGVSSKEESALKTLKEQDFLEGDIYGDGTFQVYESRDYSFLKERMNPKAGGAVDLIFTGKFVDAMYLLKPRGSRYKFGNTDKKRNILKEMYGDNIFGLNQAVFNKFQKDIIAPRLIRKIKTTANIG